MPHEYPGGDAAPADEGADASRPEATGRILAGRGNEGGAAPRGLKLEHALLGRFLLVAAVSACLTLGSHASLRWSIEDNRRVSDRYRALGYIERVLSLLSDAEAGQRNYLLVGEEGYLEPYHAALAAIAGEVALLQEGTRDNPRQQANIARLKAFIARRLTLLQETIECRRGRGLEAALAHVRTGEGRQVMDEIQAVMRAMRAEEQVLLTRYSMQRVASGELVAALSWTGVVGNLLVLVLAYRMVARDLARRQAAEERLRESQRELRAANSRLDELATTDSLTGLRNRRYFQEAMETTLALAVRERLPLSVVMLDIDRFKAYNDEFGHPAGDEVLSAVAAIVGGAARAYDVVARYGGEEFVVLLPGADAGSARVFADRVRRAIERHAWPLRPITASFGVASLGRGTERGSDLIGQADKALYRSKATGRSRVTHWLDLVADAEGLLPAGGDLLARGGVVSLVS